MGDSEKVQKQTIEDFGEQWQMFDDIDTGYYGEQILFADILHPFVSEDDIRGCRVADIGSGTGRIVRMLAMAQPEKIIAVEPSAAYEVLLRNTCDILEQVDYLNIPSDELPENLQLDWVVSIGVVHHIPDPKPTMRAAWSALKPGGHMVVWLYGKEGNGLYLTLVQPVRSLTKLLPAPMLKGFSWCLLPPLKLYSAFCRWLPLPMRSYFLDHVQKLDNRQLLATVYDQLNPAYAKYYTQNEESGFVDVRTRHRHGYSWTVCGQKPLADQQKKSTNSE
jgi:SAM-dependent methyltransferase